MSVRSYISIVSYGEQSTSNIFPILHLLLSTCSPSSYQFHQLHKIYQEKKPRYTTKNHIKLFNQTPKIPHHRILKLLGITSSLLRSKTLMAKFPNSENIHCDG